jgi:hypothetical protein
VWRNRTDRQVTQPSSFSYSERSTATTCSPRCSSSTRVRGALVLISTTSLPSSTTCDPASSGTARNDGHTAGSSTSGG